MTYPGPDVLGRGLVVRPGEPVPAPFETAPRVVVDEDVLARPEAAAAVLHDAWTNRRRVVVELAVPAEDVRAPEAESRPPYLIDPGFTFARERLHFLVWANSYDARRGEPVWWHGVRALRLGAQAGGTADVVLPDGRLAWCDGGPRRPVGLPEAVVHRDSIDAGRLPVARHREPAGGEGVPPEVNRGEGVPPEVNRGEGVPPGVAAGLAPDQLAAVTHPGGPARIIAPAGSGKTRVLTERIRHLLVDRAYEPGLVTAVAYNVLAAEQLRQRTAGFRPTIRTLNSLGLAVCQRRGRWRLAEEPVQREILSSLVRPQGRRRVNTDPLAPYLDALSAIRLGLLRPEAAEDAYPDAAGVAEAFPAYREKLAAAGLLDFDEQIYRGLELLLSDPELRAEVRAEARTLLVDEFQDLTPAHLLLIRLVAGPAGDVFGVGDDDQVIYGYAGADPGFLIDFERYFPGAANYDLEVNYRCPPAVVTAARTLLGHNRRRIDKRIRPAPDREDAGPGTLAVHLAPANGLGPAAVQVLTGWAEAGARFEDMAVLTRVNSSLLPVQVLLTEAGIPCTRAVGPWILERAGTAAALAYLRMGASLERIARADLRATVRRPSRRISPKVIEMLTRDAITSVRSIRGLARWLEDKDAFSREAVRVESYAADLEGVAERLGAGATTADVLIFVRDGIGLGEAMDTLDASKGALDRSSNADDLAALLQVAVLHPYPATFEAWLRETLSKTRAGVSPEAPAVSRETPAVSPETPAVSLETSANGVHLATVHRVKGREWPYVAVFGADERLFPHRLAGDVEEERRIFHVAITRARERAVVLGDASAPSPFVDELTQPAPARPPAPASLPPTWARPPATERPPAVRPASRAVSDAVPAAHGLRITAGRREAEIVEVRRGEAAVVWTDTGEVGAVEYGTDVSAGDRRGRLGASAGRVEATVAALSAWRLARARAEGKPPYVYLSNDHVRDIAERDPDTLARLARCRGIGPAKLESYGEEILGVLDGLDA